MSASPRLRSRDAMSKSSHPPAQGRVDSYTVQRAKVLEIARLGWCTCFLNRCSNRYLTLLELLNFNFYLEFSMEKTDVVPKGFKSGCLR